MEDGKIDKKGIGGDEMEMTVVSISLMAALVVSTIANIALVSRLRAVKQREEDWKNERYW